MFIELSAGMQPIGGFIFQIPPIVRPPSTPGFFLSSFLEAAAAGGLLSFLVSFLPLLST
jgi:hypothetical protein